MTTTQREPKRSEERAPRLRVLAFGALWASVSAAALFAPGCYGRNCDPSYATFGVDAGQGEMIDETTWASGPVDGAWLPFPRQRYYTFDIRALGGRTPVPTPYISAASDPNNTNSSSVIGSGNIAEFFNIGPNRIDVKNDTCSDYYLWLVLKLPPLPPAVNTTDAAVEADSGVEQDAAVNDGGDAGDGG